MKQNTLFRSEKNSLVRIEDNLAFSTSELNAVSLEKAASGTAEIPSGKNTVTAVTVPWHSVELEPGVYNEEILAALRTYLKKLEENGRFAFIVPEAEESLSDADSAGSFISAMVHTARRVKDCKSVIGFALPEQFIRNDGSAGISADGYSRWFINDMNVKHSHYVYFADDALMEQLHLDAESSFRGLVLYRM